MLLFLLLSFSFSFLSLYSHPFFGLLTLGETLRVTSMAADRPQTIQLTRRHRDVFLPDRCSCRDAGDVTLLSYSSLG